MKQLITLILIMNTSVVQSDNRYERSMLSGIESLFQAETIIQLQEVANKFERIATKEEGQWLPAYYSSLAYVWMANRENDVQKKDQWLDQSQKMLDQAMTVSEHSEITALQGFIYMIRVTVDPASRGATFSQKAFQEFGKAVAQGPENPRALFFRGQMEFGTAQFFKADTAPACDTMARSLILFDKFTPESTIHPDWGAAYARRTVENCSAE